MGAVAIAPIAVAPAPAAAGQNHNQVEYAPGRERVIRAVTTHLQWTSDLRTVVSTTTPNYSHWIRWDADVDCEAGFIAQKVTREIRFTRWRVPGLFGRGRDWGWGKEHVVPVEYWEIWEVVGLRTADGATRFRVYPGVRAADDRYATSRGLLSRIELNADHHQREEATSPQDLDYRAHDQFSQRHPWPKLHEAVKGKFRIEGSVFFLPSTDATANNWIADFLRDARRNMRFQPGKWCHSPYTGGPLWQRPGAWRAPGAGYKIMTRKEAGQFIDLTKLEPRDPMPSIGNGHLYSVSEWKSIPYY